MATKVIMPKQGLQMTEGTITSWIVKEGGKAVKDEPLFEMETDKLTITMDAPESGTLLKIIKHEGDVVPITEIIGVIGNPGEDISEFLNAAPKAAEAPKADEAPKAAPEPEKKAEPRKAGERVFITPRAKALAQEKSLDISVIPASGPEGLIIERDVKAYAQSVPKATPLAAKVASIENVSLTDVHGTGTYGKIVKADILDAAVKHNSRKGSIIPFAGMRKIIADRMVESLKVAAQASHKVTVDMTESARIREAFKSKDKKISFNDIIAFAVCRALKDFPIMNSELTAEGILVKDYINLGIAVAVEKGLIVPVIRDAGLMALEELSAAAKEMAGKAKDGKLQTDDYKGGSFTISNLGMFGLSEFTAIINQPESGILAIGKIEKMPVVVNDEIVIRPMMTLTLTYDHRVVDGAPAALFLVKIKQYLEQPYLLF